MFIYKYVVLYVVWRLCLLLLLLVVFCVFSDRIYIAPSGVQKERIDSSDLFVCDINGNDIELPSSG